MRFKKVLFLIASSLLIAGCDQEKSTFQIGVKELYDNKLFTQPLLVITPGWQMNDHGKAASLFGESLCPGKKGLMVTEVGCIIIDNTTREVTAKIIGGTAHTLRTELFTVERSGTYPEEKIMLRRPDNSYVNAWNELTNK